MPKTSTPKQLKKSNSNIGCEFPIVAIGASAGGLQAVSELLEYLPANTGMSFIYVQHLSPDYKSMLTELLGKRTKMKVQEVTNMVKLKPDNFYVVPPDKEMVVVDGHVKLSARPKEAGLHLPIDKFFISLAVKHSEHAIGVILSGAGSDGTRGLLTIKQAGGITFAQDSTAKFRSMPQSAIAEGGADFILPPNAIANEIAQLAKQFSGGYGELYKRSENEISSNSAELATIFTLLLNATGVDFSQYKINTIKRRIVRRMLLYKLKGIKEYVKLLKQKDKEVETLYGDLLINVTNFFRDTDSHRYLKSTVFPRLLKQKSRTEGIRMWVPACATGEEAYSLAMILLELQDGRPYHIPVQIFATDLSEPAIEKARVGEYTKEEVEGVSPKRLQRFYTKTNGRYRVTKIVRDMVVFAHHNILQDPPFSRIDFISCCNLLIYFEVPSQRTALNIFHYALKEEGFLMLGKSESVGTNTNLFSQINKTNKIFARRKAAGRSMPGLPFRHLNATKTQREEVRSREPKLTVSEPQIDSSVDSFLLSNYVPASAIITHDMEILQFRGANSPFLRHPQGKATLNILKMSRPEISFELRATIQKAIKTRQPVFRRGIETRIDNEVRVVNIEVAPIKIDRQPPLLLVVFREIEQVEVMGRNLSGKNVSVLKDKRIKKLEDDLAAAYTDIRTLNEVHEAAMEELQSANEEIVSSNEELQSVNEELQTSQEEIESANEELITTNQELLVRNQQLTEAYDFSETIMITMHEPLLVLDSGFRIKAANPAFYTKFKVKQDDTEGEVIFDLGNGQWNTTGLRKLLQEIIPKNAGFQDYEITHNFPNIGEKTMLLNGQRIMQKHHREHLILLAIADTSDPAYAVLKAHNRELENAVTDRTNELQEANAALEQKNEQLEYANKELSSFAYVSSHDLQEPLRKIQTIASRIVKKEEKNLSADGKDYLKRMQADANRMQRLIEDLLAYSRTGNAEKRLVKRDLNKMFDEIKSDMSEAIKDKNARVEAIGLKTIAVIPFQFKQLLCNLISNALKFSLPGVAPHVIIKQKEVNSKNIKEVDLVPGNYHLISVSDKGIGFKPEFKDRIFDVFQRLHGKSEYEGTGIGLAIVKKIVDNHKGTVTAMSEPGKGSTFNIYLPVAATK